MAINWLIKGKASAAVAKQEEAQAQKRKEEQNKMFRFYLKEGEEARVTFVDGALGPEGFLVPPRYYEHNVKINASYNNFFVCPQLTQPEAGYKCPLCEMGNRAALVALFTVIDHRVFKSNKDPSKVYTDTPKILAAKPYTFETINKLAVKRGGLAGTTWDISRVGDKAAAVGSLFDFVEKHDLEELKSKYTKEFKDEKTKTVVKKTIFVPANYEHEIIFRTEDELRKLFNVNAPSGFLGSQTGGATSTETQHPQTAPWENSPEDYDEVL